MNIDKKSNKKVIILKVFLTSLNMQKYKKIKRSLTQLRQYFKITDQTKHTI